MLNAGGMGQHSFVQTVTYRGVIHLNLPKWQESASKSYTGGVTKRSLCTFPGPKAARHYKVSMEATTELSQPTIAPQVVHAHCVLIGKFHANQGKRGCPYK